VVAVSVREARVRWRVMTTSPVRGAPAVAGDVVLTTTVDGLVVASDLATGAERWRYQLAPSATHKARATFSGATIVDGIAYVGNQQELAALDVRSGRPLWTTVPVPDGANTQSAAAPLVIGDLVLGTFERDHGGVIAFDRQTGARRWALVGETVAIKASPVSDGKHVFVVDGKDEVLAPALDGTIAWRTKLDAAGFEWGNATIGAPVYARGVLVVPTLYSDLVALDAATGDVMWRHAARTTPIRVTHYRGAAQPGYAAGPTLTGDTVWAVDTSGLAVALELTTGRPLGQLDLGLPVLAAPERAGDGVIVASYDGTLHWLVPGQAPPALAIGACPAYQPDRLRWIARVGAVLALCSFCRAVWVMRRRR
jgi:outer membrane protein assembly factor BamB